MDLRWICWSLEKILTLTTRIKPLVRLFDQPFSKLSNVLFIFMYSMANISTISYIVIAIGRPTLSVNVPFSTVQPISQQLAQSQ